ncbi:helicase-related protein [Macrococcus capreoli]|uniref:helicase-related protein n=1 Tax=Macrococcus capreoli TaxID=2982690 RepID=UPI003EE64FF8
MDVRMISNKGEDTLVNLLKKEIKKDAKITITSASFSLFAYYALRDELEKLSEFNFLFSKPTFYKLGQEVKRQYKLQLQEIYDNPKFDGNDFEIQLRNKMISTRTANQVTKWIREKATFKTIVDDYPVTKQLMVHNNLSSIYSSSDIDFTADGLGLTASNRLGMIQAFVGLDELVENALKDFNTYWNDETKVKDVTDKVLEQIELIYKENSPEWLYFVTLFNIFSNELENLNEDNVIKEGTKFKETVVWNKLFEFQKDGVLGIIDKIERFNGCILADSVGLGKTFSALAVIKYYELRNDRVLVLAPKKLRDNWLTYKQNDKKNILIEDKFRYDVLNHTDLSRDTGYTGDINLESINWSNYDLVVIDESHNFRNNNAVKNKLTRYQKLMQEVIKKGVKTKVLLLSATPVNNKMNDIKNQIAFITGDNDMALETEGVDSIDTSLRNAQAAFNKWSDLPSEERTTSNFLNMVNPEYFQILDALSIARSRKHIEKYYDVNDIGTFPSRLKPISIKTDIDLEKKFRGMEKVNELMTNLEFSIYQPMKYVLPQKRKFYEDLYDTSVERGAGRFKQTDREFAVASLMKVNIFKRLESSIHSFNKTIEKIIFKMNETIKVLEENRTTNYSNDYSETNWIDDEDLEAVTVGSNKVRIKVEDIDHIKWLNDLRYDLELLTDLYKETRDINVFRDEKLNVLTNHIKNKIKNPINPGNKKIIIFSAFADTIEYLYENLSDKLLENNIHSAMVTGSGENKTTLKGVKAKNLVDVLTNFSPISKDRDLVNPDLTEEIDILFATDCISEGQNLQDCDYLINYDIHWNPVRVIQRFGRIDRIGSRNKDIQLVNFWPNMELDEYINLEDRVKGRMKLLNTSATGEEDIFDVSGKEMNDIEYRRNQLKSLQDEGINLEDVSGAISITDLTYTDFKSDLSHALKEYKKDLEKAPKGMYAIVSNNVLKEAEPGVIFCFKQNADIDMSNNSLEPYILLYLKNNGDSLLHYTNAKTILDFYRKLALGQKEPFADLVAQFNQETDNGEDMSIYTDLLKKSIDVVKNKQEESAFDSFFTPGGTDIQQSFNLDFNDIELISFLIIKGD